MSDGSSVTPNAEYLEQAYAAWKQDPASVPTDLSHFFTGFEFGHGRSIASAEQALQSSVDSLVYHYRSVGHKLAQINPLGGNPTSVPELELSRFGLSEKHLDSTFSANHIPGVEKATLREIITHMHETYCGFIGVEYVHIQDTEERRWLQDRMERTRNTPTLSRDQKTRILWKIEQAEMFEQFLHSTYRGQKRFSLEGSETTIAAFDHLIQRSPDFGIEEIVIGMAHRGRLNVLANILEKSYDEIFKEFEDNFVFDSRYGDGDVKYHKGYSKDITTLGGAQVHLSLTANPSHLEAVSPVVVGRVRAKQSLKSDTQRKRIIPFVLHGDAAFAGQGIVAETLNMSQLKGYSVGGTIHFIINNQLGFTTVPQDYLSGLYCTDVAKMIAVPIFHVNGDHPEHVVLAMELALEYRQAFGKDVVVDMWSYRRHGHNEGDEPSFTQPLLYEKIGRQPSVVDLYQQQLQSEGSPTVADVTTIADQFEARFEKQLETAKEMAARDHGALNPVVLSHGWYGLKNEYSDDDITTGVNIETLQALGQKLAEIPETFKVHAKVRKIVEDFAKKVATGDGLAWANGEALAFGTLLLEGRSVRLSGEDSRRGTFSQRHAVLYDQSTGGQYIPLTQLGANQGEFSVYDSSLAEASVLAFDYGYSLSDPSMLVMWEAQFGDFANGAQVIIDQFIAGSMSKWGRYSGLVLLLPHGYEGQGPEHSNAWLGRYLALCAEENIQVVNPSTPAQYFHVLRRQVKRDFRRPLIVMTPKSMLRNPKCVSKLEDFTSGHFQVLIDDERKPQNVRRVVFCAGKVYYELMEAAQKAGAEDVAIVRVEQFYPIHEAAWEVISARYGDVAEWVWVSEEPSNFGAWPFMMESLSQWSDASIWYVGRARSASPATGSLSYHKRQQQRILDSALAPGRLQSELEDGVAVFTRGAELWHMKSKSPLLASPSPKAP